MLINQSLPYSRQHTKKTITLLSKLKFSDCAPAVIVLSESVVAWSMKKSPDVDPVFVSWDVSSFVDPVNMMSMLESAAGPDFEKEEERDNILLTQYIFPVDIVMYMYTYDGGLKSS